MSKKDSQVLINSLQIIIFILGIFYIISIFITKQYSTPPYLVLTSFGVSVFFLLLTGLFKVNLLSVHKTTKNNLKGFYLILLLTFSVIIGTIIIFWEVEFSAKWADAITALSLMLTISTGFITNSFNRHLFKVS